ncbi:hypothetical protein [Chamaesiphon minutus]|uniref:Uncharacterized protein n=1 Tax=Chamaesiphon minutus (strain ATCC 27169 / PCC 6605) TaxID=1173020 RepID=K9UQ09_CHAP6|nr:hypothetical protein [Chamaesiphon minutus]AFY96531.1 hypothetical protein Cha6605_5671 [Chamaesiphon minutus PCC 6605]
MESQVPLHGIDLIDCAQANANQGIKLAAQQCGYRDDLTAFDRELTVATAQIGVKINGFQDLIKTIEPGQVRGIEIAPDSDTKI